MLLLRWPKPGVYVASGAAPPVSWSSVSPSVWKTRVHPSRSGSLGFPPRHKAPATTAGPPAPRTVPPRSPCPRYHPVPTRGAIRVSRASALAPSPFVLPPSSSYRHLLLRRQAIPVFTRAANSVSRASAFPAQLPGRAHGSRLPRTELPSEALVFGERRRPFPSSHPEHPMFLPASSTAPRTPLRSTANADRNGGSLSLPPRRPLQFHLQCTGSGQKRTEADRSGQKRTEADTSGQKPAPRVLVPARAHVHFSGPVLRNNQMLPPSPRLRMCLYLPPPQGAHFGGDKQLRPSVFRFSSFAVAALRPIALE